MQIYNRLGSHLSGLRRLRRCLLLWLSLILVLPVTINARGAQGPLRESLQAEASWTFIAPPTGGWVSRPSVIRVQVQDSDGLWRESALYRYSIDGGLTWSDWLTDGLTTHSPEPTTVFLTLTTSSLVESPTLNRVEFSILDLLGTNELSGAHTIPVDGTPPTVVALPDKAGPWVQPPVTIALQANDPLSGVERTEYRLLMTMTWHAGESIVIDGSLGDGAYTYEYRAWDRAGNVSAIQLITVNVDGRPPSCSASAQGPVGEDPSWFTGCVTITLTASDAHSGLAAFHYQIEGQEAITVPIAGGPRTASHAFTLCEECSRKSISHWASDLAGNVAAAGTLSVKLDRRAPLAPMNVTVNPLGWSQNNAFTLCWNNPEDCSGIAAAYYKLGSPPTANSDGQLVHLPAGTPPCLSVTVAQEGQTPIYLWLKDRAGLVDYRTAVSATLRYDHTPPRVESMTVEGPVGEDTLWFTDCVTVTLTASDAHSGLAAFHYQIEGQEAITVPIAGGPRTASHAFTLCYDCGRKSIFSWASDLAGQIATPYTATVRLDRQPPMAPSNVTVSPAGWSNANAFSLSWNNPEDCSGIAAAYYKLGSPPTTNRDGQLHVLPLGGQPTLPAISVAQEGQTPIYLWLKDRAGLVDYRTAVSATLRYDATPPATTAVITGTLGRGGYYVSPVVVCFNASDNASGVAETRYRLSGGAWQVGQCITLTTEGTHVIEYYSVDVAGNQEAVRTTQPIRLDLNAPTCTLRISPDYLASPSQSATICWAGSDGPKGSGVVTYTVQYRQGACGPWQPWLTNVTQTCAIRTGLVANHFHYFRVRAEDRAGYVSEWTAPSRDLIYVEGLVNPSFDSCDWPLWIPAPDSAGQLTARVVVSTTRRGENSCMARLSKDWPVSEVPVNAYASFYQAIQLPAVECGRNQGLMLSFWYRILTYDKAWSKISDGGTPNDPSDDVWGWVDNFEVRILDREGRELAVVLRDGYFGVHERYTLYDLGWRHYSVDLTPWAGQQVRVEFRVWNRMDKWWPTWVYVDDVRLLPATSYNYNIAVPLLLNQRQLRFTSLRSAEGSGELIDAGPDRADEPPQRW